LGAIPALKGKARRGDILDGHKKGTYVEKKRKGFNGLSRKGGWYGPKKGKN